MVGIFHIHTSYSFDANVPPKKIVDRLQKLGVDFAAITDHETIKGAVEAKNICRARPMCLPKNKELTHGSTPAPLQIIVGAEYHTEKGDIIGLFLEEEVKSRKSDEVIKEIKDQGGITVLPHPFKSHRLDPELIQAMDVIEVFNSRATKAQNAKALALAREYKKPGIAGSDAHFLQEIGLTRMSFGTSTQVGIGQGTHTTIDLKKAILNGEGKVIKADKSRLSSSVLTGLINLYKTKNSSLPLRWAKKLHTLDLLYSSY